MAQAAERYPEQKAQCEEAFKNYAFGEERLWHSGLMSELFAGFYQLMANVC